MIGRNPLTKTERKTGGGKGYRLLEVRGLFGNFTTSE